MSALYFIGMIGLGLVLTLVLEGVVLLPLLLKQNDKMPLAAFALVNVATNISINVIIYLVGLFGCFLDGFMSEGLRFALIVIALLLEILVVQIEYCILKKFVEHRHLFWYVLGANALSAVVGSILLALLSSI